MRQPPFYDKNRKVMFNNILSAKLQFNVGMEGEWRAEPVFAVGVRADLATAHPRPLAATGSGVRRRGGGEDAAVLRGNGLGGAGAEGNPAAVEAEAHERDRHILLQQEVYLCRY